MAGKRPSFTDEYLIRHFKTNPWGQYTIAFLGTTLFGRLKWYAAHEPRIFKENPCILNLGGHLGADKIQNVLALIDQGFLRSLQNHQPNLQSFYLQMGTDHLTENGLSNSAVQDYARVVESIREEFPNAQIILTAFLMQRGLSETAIERANDALRYIAQQDSKSVEFLPFGPDQKGIMSSDGIHLTSDGYRKWYHFLQGDIDNR